MKELKKNKPNILTTDDFKLDIETWLDHYAEENSVTLNYHGQMMFRGEPIGIVNFQDRLYIDAKKYSGKFSERSITASFNLFYSREKDKIFKAAANQIANAFSPTPKCLISQFVQAITGVAEPKHVAVFRHFIWQVKRRMLGLKVEHHRMIVLVGEQGAGKTEAIKAFLKPLHELTLGKGVNEITDERQWEMFRRYPVIVLDEMAQAEKACLETLKRVVSAEEYLSYRPMRTNHQEVLKPISTFIGSSNLFLSEVIKDKTGNRRFDQLKTLDRMDWGLINSLDYHSIWLSVNAYEECPILSNLEDLKKDQSNDRYKLSIDYFIEDYEIVSNPQYKISTDVLWATYRKWCESSGEMPYGKNHFGRELSRLKFKCARLGKSGKGFYVSSSKISGESEVMERVVEREDVKLTPFAEDLLNRLGEPEHDKMSPWIHESISEKPS